MPLLLRLGQCTLRGSLGGLGRYVEPTGLWNLLEEFSTELYGGKFQYN